MNYILKYFIPSKYIGFKKKYYMEFNSLNNLLKYIIDNKIKDFTIYELYDNVNYKEDIYE